MTQRQVTSYDVRGQIFTTFNSEGEVLTTPEVLAGEFRVNTYNGGSSVPDPSVTALEGTDAGFVVTWQDQTQVASNGGIQLPDYPRTAACLTIATGTPVGDEFMVNTYINEPRVDAVDFEPLADGGFIW